RPSSSSRTANRRSASSARRARAPSSRTWPSSSLDHAGCALRRAAASPGTKLTDRPVLRAGTDGDAVRELQRRLAALGFAVPNDEKGRFGSATEAEVRAFQEQRSLRIDGVCGAETWGALVESEFHLGDRMLYVRRPMLRGDDVSDLQHRLNGLGF